MLKDECVNSLKSLNEKGKVLYKDFGELLFTHFGISGPTVLSASAHMKGSCKLVIDLKPALDDNKLDERILRDLDTYRNRSMENALTDLLPRSMIPVVLRRLSVDPQLQANSLRKQDRRALVELLKNFTVTVTDEDGDGLPEFPALPDISVEDAIRIYGGKVVYEKEKKETTRPQRVVGRKAVREGREKNAPLPGKKPASR